MENQLEKNPKLLCKMYETYVETKVQDCIDLSIRIVTLFGKLESTLYLKQKMNTVKYFMGLFMYILLEKAK